MDHQNLDCLLLTVQVYQQLMVNWGLSRVDRQQWIIEICTVNSVPTTVDHLYPDLNVKKNVVNKFLEFFMLSLSQFPQKFKFYLKWHDFKKIADSFSTLGILKTVQYFFSQYLTFFSNIIQLLTIQFPILIVHCWWSTIDANLLNVQLNLQEWIFLLLLIRVTFLAYASFCYLFWYFPSLSKKWKIYWWKNFQ